MEEEGGANEVKLKGAVEGAEKVEVFEEVKVNGAVRGRWGEEVVAEELNLKGEVEGAEEEEKLKELKFEGTVEEDNNGAEEVEEEEPKVEGEKVELVGGEMAIWGVLWEGGKEKGKIGSLVV